MSIMEGKKDIFAECKAKLETSLMVLIQLYLHSHSPTSFPTCTL